MSITTLTAARIYKGQLAGRSGEEGNLFFESFPFSALIKTFNADRQVPDSAGTATAFLTGVKANYETLGVNAQVKSGDTDCKKIQENSVPSILQWAVDSGKAAGVVTTTRITHATPAASYAHTSMRNWESDADKPPQLDKECSDIAKQLIFDSPGRKLRVIMGGGRRSFLTKTTNDPKANQTGYRLDDDDLIEEWLKMRRNEGLSRSEYLYINSTRGLHTVKDDPNNSVKYLFGLFNWTNMAYEAERDKSEDGEPSLKDMTTSAIKVLSKEKNGFVLLVEGGRIDHAHHQNLAGMALREVMSFDAAIEAAAKSVNLKETLIIVTADHAHTLTMNGYPLRGQSIFGYSDVNDTAGVPFPVLMYGNGPGHNSSRIQDHSNPRAVFPSAVQLNPDANHGGEDVGLYATGPFAHLFKGLKDQTFIAHAISFAACMGNYNNSHHCNGSVRLATGQAYLLFLPILVVVSVILGKNL